MGKYIRFSCVKYKKYVKFNPTASNMQYFFIFRCDARYLSIIIVGYCRTMLLYSKYALIYVSIYTYGIASIYGYRGIDP